MAERVNVVKLLQELRGFAEMTYRRPLPPVAWKQSHAVLPPPISLRRILFVRGDPADDLTTAVPIRLRPPTPGGKPARAIRPPQ